MSGFLRTRWARFTVLFAAVGVVLFLTPKVPRDQTLHVDLGRGSPHVRELIIRWVAAEKGGKTGSRSANIEDWTDEATFRYETGAPRVVEQTARLSDGDYVVEIEASGGGRQSTVMRYDVTLASGRATTIDASSLALGLDSGGADARAAKGDLDEDGGS